MMSLVERYRPMLIDTVSDKYSNCAEQDLTEDSIKYEIQHALLDMYTEQYNNTEEETPLTREQLIEQLVQERDAINLRLNDIATELSSLYTEEEKGAIVDDILTRWLRVTEQPY